MRKRIPAWAWLPVGMLIGLAAARLILAPRILERWPAPGASAPGMADIRITFDRPMDAASVAERLRIDPAQAGHVLWQGSTFIYRPSQAWPSGGTVEVRLDSGARSQSGLGTLAAARWSFTVAQARLAYLWPADGMAQVYARVPGETQALPLTAAPGGVTDFSIGGRGTRVVYVAMTGEESAELRELDLVRNQDRVWFACPAAERCTSPQLSPDGRTLAFVRTPLQTAISGQARGRVWLLEDGSTTPVAVSPEGDVASAPSWSPQGWLSFVDSTHGAILVVEPTQGAPFAPLATLPSRLGERGAWSPDGSALIYPDLILPAEGSSHDEGDANPLVMETHLLRWDVFTGNLTDLTARAGWQAEDASPTFTSDGQWAFFSRTLLAAGEWTPGRQLWRMRVDGSQAERLTDEPFINHGAPAVGPQGRLVAYLRFNVEAPLDPAQIWLLDPETRRGALVAEGGYLPAWIP